MEHLQTIPSTMADRERPLSMENNRNSDQFGSQKSLSNLSNSVSMGSQQHLLSNTENIQTNGQTQANGQTLMAGIRSSSGSLGQRNKFEPQPKRTIR